MEKKSDSYDAISSLLSDIDLLLQENMDVLRRAELFLSLQDQQYPKTQYMKMWQMSATM